MHTAILLKICRGKALDVSDFLNYKLEPLLSSHGVRNGLKVENANLNISVISNAADVILNKYTLLWGI